MTRLKTDAGLTDPDGFYTALLSTHHGMSETESHALNARLVLILANHIGDMGVLRSALDLAKNGPAAE